MAEKRKNQKAEVGNQVKLVENIVEDDGRHHRKTASEESSVFVESLTTEDNILIKNRIKSEDIKFKILVKSENDQVKIKSARSRGDPPEQSHKLTPNKLKIQKKFLENASAITPSKSQRTGGVGAPRNHSDLAKMEKKGGYIAPETPPGCL